MSIGQHRVVISPDDGSDPLDISCLVDQVAIHHGREDTGSQPEASTTTVDLDLGGTELPPQVEMGAGLVVVTTISPGVESVRFAGQVTDVTLGWDDEGANTPNAGIGQVIAAGPLASLGRRVVGDEPWGQELDGARVARILALADVIVDPLTSDPGTVQILARDVDSTDALSLTQDVAASARGILWQTKDGEVRYADAAHRRGAETELTIDTCDILVTPSWSRTLQGMVNQVSIGYGADAEGGEQPRIQDDNAASISRYGVYAFTTATLLAAAADAQAMASLLLARNSTPVWVMPSLPVDIKSLSDEDTATLLDLDMHSLILLTGLPVIAPSAPTTAALWVEGFSETLAWGVHEISLAVSGYCRTAPAPRWDDVPSTWTWDNISPDLTWDEAVCMGAHPDTGIWAAVPASQRWDATPPEVTWDTYNDGAS